MQACHPFAAGFRDARGGLRGAQHMGFDAELAGCRAPGFPTREHRGIVGCVDKAGAAKPQILSDFTGQTVPQRHREKRQGHLAWVAVLQAAPAPCAAGLLTGDMALFEQSDGQAPFREIIGRCGPDDAAADDDDVHGIGQALVARDRTNDWIHLEEPLSMVGAGRYRRITDI